MSRNFELLNQMGKTPVMVPAEADPLTPQEGEPVDFIAPLEMDPMAREEITKLVHRLFLLATSDAPRRVVFSATEPGNGTSWVCARVAEILASQVGRTVCVVDCNLRAPSLHEQFGVENSHGLSEALRGDGPIRQYARQLRKNLWLISTGNTNESAQGLLTSDRMRMRVAELGSQFDYVLMDVAAINSSNHGIVLGHLVDGIALVLKANSSRRDSTRETIQLLQSSNVRVLGAVLNQRTFPIPDHIYNRL